MMRDEDDNDQIAKAIENLAVHAKYLGLGDAVTTMRAIEHLATKVEESGESIGAGLDGLAVAVREVAVAQAGGREMKSLGKVPPETLARKPAHGNPCNGCGACCMVTRCPLGQHVFKLPEVGPCPALTQTSETTYACGLVLDPRKWTPARAASKGVEALRRAALLLIGSGDGCDARFNGEWRDEVYAAALDAACATPQQAKASRRAKLLWGASKKR